jgi:hypothetical protein
MRPLHHVIPGAIDELLRKAPLSPGKVAFAWKTAVGTAVERATSVRLDGDTLIVEAASAQWTREIARSSPIILTRLQEFLGKATVARITVRSIGRDAQAPISGSPSPHRS